MLRKLSLNTAEKHRCLQSFESSVCQVFDAVNSFFQFNHFVVMKLDLEPGHEMWELPLSRKIIFTRKLNNRVEYPILSILV